VIGLSTLRGAVIALAVWAALGLLRFKPWVPDPNRVKESGGPSATADGRERLRVGFLPVT
jgi:hypothetical protein